MQYIDVQMNFDSNRAKYGLITVVSMLENIFTRNSQPCAHINLHIIHYDVPREMLDKYHELEHIYEGKLTVYEYDFKKYWNELPENKRVEFPTNKLGKFNYEVLAAPIYAAWILPKWVKHIIHIDDDCIVNGHIGNLWDLRSDSVPYQGCFELSDKYTIINSGVTIHNLHIINHDSLIDKLIEMSHEKSYTYFEQELWNDLYFNKLNSYEVLPFQYNWIIRYQHHKCRRIKYIEDARYKLTENEVYKLRLSWDATKYLLRTYPSTYAIVHYSRVKPWSRKYNLPLRWLWDKYKCITTNRLGITYELVD